VRLIFSKRCVKIYVQMRHREVRITAMQESGEMYLETIYVLSRSMDDVHAVNIASHLGYSKPSVSRAMSILKREGYVNVDGEGRITLSDRGMEIASRIYERHEVLGGYLTALGVDREVAVEDACRIEHVISCESFDRIKEEYRRIKERQAAAPQAKAAADKG